jgi:hypothetical protein
LFLEFFSLKSDNLGAFFYRESFVEVTLDLFFGHTNNDKNTPKEKKKRRMISTSKSRIRPC